MARSFAATYSKTDGVFVESFPRRRSVGHFRAAPHQHVQTIRADKGRMAREGQTSEPAEGVCLHNFRVGKTGQTTPPNVHARLRQGLVL